MKNNFSFAGKDVVLLAKKIGTPFFLFDEKKIEENFFVLESSFSSVYNNLRIDYSAKTNLELSILRIIKNLGAGLEISSVHELEIGKKAGFSPSQMIWDSPVKKEEEIKKMLSEKIHAFYLDNLDDVKRVQKAASEEKRRADVVLRVNPGFPLAFLNLAEQYLRKFGIPEKEVISIADFIKSRCSSLSLIGLSTHVGSQQLTPRAHLRALRKLFSLARILKERGILLQELCIGGGFPSPTLDKKTTISLALSLFGIRLKQQPVSVKDFGKEITGEFSQMAKGLGLRPILVIQPGRSVVSDAGIAVGKVMAVKRNWVFLDLSTSFLPESLFFGQRKIFLANKFYQRPEVKCNVAGRGLNTADNLAILYPLPKPEVGDIAVICDAGAYSLSRSNHFTVLNPPVYLVAKSGQIRKIRREETYEDIILSMEI
jgi:diaminopimelate decarboxylase